MADWEEVLPVTFEDIQLWLH